MLHVLRFHAAKPHGFGSMVYADGRLAAEASQELHKSAEEAWALVWYRVFILL